MRRDKHIVPGPRPGELDGLGGDIEEESATRPLLGPPHFSEGAPEEPDTSANAPDPVLNEQARSIDGIARPSERDAIDAKASAAQSIEESVAKRAIALGDLVGDELVNEEPMLVVRERPRERPTRCEGRDDGGVRREDDGLTNLRERAPELVGQRRDERLLSPKELLLGNDGFPFPGRDEGKDNLTLGEREGRSASRLEQSDVREDEVLVVWSARLGEAPRSAREPRADLPSQSPTHEVPHMRDDTMKSLVTKNVIPAERMSQVGTIDAKPHMRERGRERLAGLEEGEPAIIEPSEGSLSPSGIIGRERPLGEPLGAKGRPDDAALAVVMRLNRERRGHGERLIDAPSRRLFAAVTIDGKQLDGNGGKPAPTRKRRLDPGPMQIEPLGIHGLVKRNDGPAPIPRRSPLELVPMVPKEPNPITRAIAPSLDLDDLGIHGKNADEPDAILTNLGRIPLLGGIEEREQRPLDDAAVHTAPIILEGGERDPRDALEANGDASRASIDTILDELPNERMRIRELPHHLGNRPNLGLLRNLTSPFRPIRHTSATLPHPPKKQVPTQTKSSKSEPPRAQTRAIHRRNDALPKTTT